MRGIRILWIGSFLITILFVSGFVWAYFDQNSSHRSVMVGSTPASPTVPSGEVKIVALGDSLTHGFGDTGGKGYVGGIVDQLRLHSQSTVSVSNLAINGQTSSQLLQQLSQKEVLRQLEQANMIMMTIGGNDLNRGARSMTDLTSAQVTELLSTYKNNLSKILKQIRKVNSHATLYFIGLYNPYLNAPNADETSQIIRQWNYETGEVIAQYPNSIFVPTFDLFEQHEEQYLFSDHFHPNTKGYQRISERLTPLLIP